MYEIDSPRPTIDKIIIYSMTGETHNNSTMNTKQLNRQRKNVAENKINQPTRGSRKNLYKTTLQSLPLLQASV